jgi:hypothetical protein
MVRGGDVALLKKLFARLERFGLQTRFAGDGPAVSTTSCAAFGFASDYWPVVRFFARWPGTRDPPKGRVPLFLCDERLDIRKRSRFKGWGVVHRSDEVSQRGCQMYRDMGLALEVRAVVLIRVERALPVISHTTVVIQKNRSKTAGASMARALLGSRRVMAITLWGEIPLVRYARHSSL